MFSGPLQPDPDSAMDVLAFVLCPAQAFAGQGDLDEMELVHELIGSMKAEAIHRWWEKKQRLRRN